ncbi:MAG: hypothetical protein E7305_01775 [Butyrivibrio sp.]|nr:hypothetical protein [Butyrivibrio sp.]
MDKQEKIKIAITAGIAAVILLILVLVLTLSGAKDSGDEQKLNENIQEYAEGAASLASITDAITASQEASSSQSTEDEKEESSSASDSSSTDVLTTTAGMEKAKETVSGNSFYATDKATLKNVYKNLKIDVDMQLKELSSYWASDNMTAVRDLVHLERYEAMSYQLSGSNDFYYYGETNGEGKPNGTGLAVYGDDQYYYGQWSDGVRSGDGTWISFYPGYSQYVVTEHLFTGQWANDLPNGKGQEHYDYNYADMNTADYYLQNAIGEFSDGLYNGEMYIITVDKDEKTIEWEGTCKKGSWEQVLYTTVDSKGKIPYLSQIEDSDRHLYMTLEGAKNNGVRGIIYGGNVKGY